MLACSGKGDDATRDSASLDATTNTGVTDTDIEPLPAEADVLPVEVVAEVSDTMGTVLTVRWSTRDPATGYVEFGLDGVMSRSTAVQDTAALSHQVQLVGLPETSVVSYRVVSAGMAGEAATSEIFEVSTGTLPLVPPSIDVAGEGHEGFLVLPVLGVENTHLVVVDAEGRVVWIYEDTHALSVYRARVAQDGRGIVYTATLKSGGPHEGSSILRIPWDGSGEEVIDAPFLAHDFVELADGTVVSLAYAFQEDVEGNKLVSVAPDGTMTDLWSTWDCFDPSVNLSVDPAHGWTHANALDYDPVSDAFLVGLRNLGTIVHVDRATGSCTWSFGGAAGSVAIDGPSFLHQHQFHWTDGGFLVFDNDGAPGNTSRVLEYTFDAVNGTAEHVRTLTADPPIYSFILGDVHAMAGGDRLVVWAVAGLVDRIAPDDSHPWRMSFEPGTVLGFAEWIADPGKPVLPGQP
jgi:hypothetical protein